MLSGTIFVISHTINNKEITKILFHLKNLEYVCGTVVINNQKMNKYGL